jgi:hypothetical protein
MACRYNPSKEFLALLEAWACVLLIPILTRAPALEQYWHWSRCINKNKSRKKTDCSKDFARPLRTNPAKHERGLWFDDLSIHLKQRVHKKIDRPVLRFRIDYQVATLR